MSSSKSDKDLICFLLEQIQELEKYLGGIEAYSFYNNSMLKDACFAKLLIIGEYSKRVSKAVQEKYPEIEWEVIAQARNFYAHAYNALDWTRVWETLIKEIPKLKTGLEIILAVLQK